MMAPIPPLAPPAPSTDTGLPEVRLDARIGSGRSLSFDLQRGEMLIGGAEGCDLRLPGSHLPAVICQFTRTGQNVSFRRLAPAFPILHNGNPLVGTSPVKIGPGDRIAIGTADIVVNLHTNGHLKPSFVPLEKKAAFQKSPGADATRLDNSREKQALDALKAQLAEQAKELEADRVAWYRRRQDVEAEVRRMQESVTAGTKQAEREQWLAKREADVQAKENELYGVREELAEIRESLFAQYRERRSQLGQMQDAVQEASVAFEQRERDLEAEYSRRRAELDDEAGRLQEYVAAEVARRVADVEGEYRRRHMEAEVKYSAKISELEAEAHQRREQLTRELNTFEPQMATLVAERAQLDHGFRDLTHQRQSLETLREELKRERTALEAERRWQEERHHERENLLSAREGELARTEERLHALRGEEDQRKDKYSEEMLQIERWQATADERQQAIDLRAAEVDQRVQQLARDAAELEEHMKLAEAEQQGNAAEAERLDRWRIELDSRASQLAERSSELETQQASLAIIQAQLDRQREEQQRETLALAADRARIEDHLRENEEIRTSLHSARTVSETEVQEFERRTAMLDAAFKELQLQKDGFLAEINRIAEKELDLDARSADIAQQTAVLKAKTHQVFDLRERLEADRLALRERENTVVESDQARAAFQESLRKRSEELAQRSKQLDDLNARLTEDKLGTDRLRVELAQDRERFEATIAEERKQLDERETELAMQSETLAEREASLARQVERLRIVGQTVAAGRKAAFEQKQQFELEQAELLEQSLSTRRDLETFRIRAAAEIEHLRNQAPELEDQAKFTFEKLNSAREILKGQLSELHTYAAESREALDTLRYELRSESDRIRNREEELDRARAEHRVAVAEFRQQLHDWQAKVGELRTTMARSEYRIEQKKADLAVAGRKTEATAGELARRMEELQIQQDDVASRRIHLEAHLNDMREWYRKKLRDLAEERAASPRPSLKRWPGDADAAGDSETEVILDPGDRQLGELLQSLELVDSETLNDLWAEAQRQRRTLRQVLLSSGVISLYQLALIEAGNLEALVIGRFRVIDRVRATPREAVYRVFDPERPSEACVLRILGDAEMNDATRPDEYRQRFAAAAEANHPGLIATYEVLEIQGRPAVVQEWASGIPASEWPIGAAVPGIWLQLVIEAASAVEAAHKAGLVHGRLTTEAITLLPNGSLKLHGFGEPPWLQSRKDAVEVGSEYDLRALGQVALLWSQLGAKKKGRTAKAFPEALLDVLRRLDADVTGAGTAGEPYASATELLSDLLTLAEKFPCPGEAWAEFLGQIAVQPTLPMPAKKSA